MDNNDYSNFSEVIKETEENKVNEKLKEGWVLITVGNMMQVQNVTEERVVKKAIGQKPYYILGRLKKN